MIDEPAARTGRRPRSREQLLRALHDEPRNVTRAEIKAAFADGRLGDQDLDIPVLAGMRRITELLSELEPGATIAADITDTPAFGTAVAGRATSTSVRVQKVEGQLDRMTDRLAALESQAAADRASMLTHVSTELELRQAIAGQGRRLRVVTALVVFLVALVAILLVVRLTNL